MRCEIKYIALFINFEIKISDTLKLLNQNFLTEFYTISRYYEIQNLILK